MDKVYIYIYIIGKVQWRDEGPVRGRLSLGKFGERLRVGITSGYGRWRSKCILMKAEEGRSKDTAKITAYVERYSRVNHHEASYVTEVHNWKTLFFPFNLQERLQSLFTFSPSAHIDSWKFRRFQREWKFIGRRVGRYFNEFSVNLERCNVHFKACLPFLLIEEHLSPTAYDVKIVKIGSVIQRLSRNSRMLNQLPRQNRNPRPGKMQNSEFLTSVHVNPCNLPNNFLDRYT